MLVETFLLEYYSIARDYNMYLFLVPSVYFLFNFVIRIKVKESALYNKLGIMSRLIFYVHTWILFAVNQMFQYAPEKLLATPLRFAIVVIITMIISLIVIKLSDKDRFNWLKKMY